MAYTSSIALELSLHFFASESGKDTSKLISLDTLCRALSNLGLQPERLLGEVNTGSAKLEVKRSDDLQTSADELLHLYNTVQELRNEVRALLEEKATLLHDLREKSMTQENLIECISRLQRQMDGQLDDRTEAWNRISSEDELFLAD